MPPRSSSTFSQWPASPASPHSRQNGKSVLVRRSASRLCFASHFLRSRPHRIRALHLNSGHVSLCFHARRPRHLRKVRPPHSSRPCPQRSTRRLYPYRDGRDLQSSHRVWLSSPLFQPAADALFSFIVTISAWTEPGCKNPDNDPHAEPLGDDFKNGLPGWCSTKKAGAIFFWLVFGQSLQLFLDTRY